MQIHYQLATLKKENSSIIDYSHQFTSFANTLATIDQPLNDFGVFGFLLAGLESKYDSFVQWQRHVQLKVFLWTPLLEKKPEIFFLIFYICSILGTPSNHLKKKNYTFYFQAKKMAKNFFWTKVWKENIYNNNNNRKPLKA